MLAFSISNNLLPSILAGILISGVVKALEASTSSCALLNRFPPPQLKTQSPASDPVLSRYLKDFTAAFDEFSGNSSLAGYNTSHTSFSIIIAHPNHNEQTTGGPIWQYHYTSEITDPRGTKDVTSDTRFRVGSVSKLITMVGVVKAGLHLDSSIVKYLPELKSKGHHTGMRKWEDVTVRSLGSHLAGVQRDFGWTELSAFDTSTKLPGRNVLYQNLGLPPLDDKEFPQCEFPPYYPQTCSEKQLLEIVSSQPPVVPPFSQPIYSNTAFALLAYAVERVKKTSFEKFLQKEVFAPLNMTRTSFSQKVKDSDGSIPPIPNSWGYDTAAQTPGGGLYSTSSDLAKLLLALLPSVQNKKPLFKPHPVAATKFLLPSSLVPSTNNFFLGAPWEIYRPEANHGGLTIYTKSGSLQAYSAQTVLIPEYDIVMSIVTSGDGIADLLLDKILRYLDDGKEKGFIVGGFGEIAKRETAENYDGVYVSWNKQLNSTIELQTDRGSASGGIIVSNWVSNGTNFLDTLAFIRGLGGAADIVARLYPVDLFGTVVDLAVAPTGKVRKEEWKLVVEIKEQPSTDTPESGQYRSHLDGVCFTFSLAELGGRWGDEALSRFVIFRSETHEKSNGTNLGREIIALEIPALRVVMKK